MEVTYIIIEHVEETYGLWLLFEYINASVTIGKDKIIYSNINNYRVERILRKFGRVYNSRIKNYIEEERLVILDPSADHVLTPMETVKYEGIVIGGILGDHPPKKRTLKLISRFYPNSPRRSLGREQLSIDGAAYTAYLISRGIYLDEIMFLDGIEIKCKESTILLPYKYPLINGKILFSNVLKKILAEVGIFDTYWTREI